MKPLYIFDLDGTLALVEHRVNYLKNTDGSLRWKRFYDACDKDRPNLPVIETMHKLRTFADVWIFSGRSDEVRQKTVDWLVEHTSFLTHELDSNLVMRREGDYTPDDELKESWLNNMLVDDRKRLVAVFDDRDKVVGMWRKNGVTCFQVADGGF